MMILDILSALHSWLVPDAHAQSISAIANGVANGLLGQFGGGGFTGIAEFLRGRILLILSPVGIFLVVRAGLKLINSQDDDKLTKAKNTIAATCVGIMLAFISDRLVMAFYAPGGTWNRGTSSAGAAILATEILGILNWSTVFIAVLGVLMIIVSGLKTISTFGGEDTGPVKRTVSGVATGILMITTSGAVKLALGLLPDVAPSLPGAGSPDPVIDRGVDIVLAILGFTSLIAMAVIIYAGMMMVLNFSNEENYTKGKSLIYRSVIGLAVMLLSGAAVVFIKNLLI
jgi:hypothetical protein